MYSKNPFPWGYLKKTEQLPEEFLDVFMEDITVWVSATLKNNSKNILVSGRPGQVAKLKTF